jgi:predicted glutamine amidotransferase
MCRLYACRASVPVPCAQDLLHEVNALVRQSCRDREGEKHADGWGIGYYQATVPEVERGTGPAFDDPAFAACAARVRTPMVLAHVRAGSVGERSLVNTHPFRHGRWLFAHNGTITAFERVGLALATEAAPRFLAGRRGQTDSELVFCWLLSRMAAAGLDPDVPDADLGALRRLFADVVRELAQRCDQAGATEPAGLNFVLTDGQRLLASRHGRSLFWRERSGAAGGRAVAIASEPTDAGPWHHVAEGSILAVDAGLQVFV